MRKPFIYASILLLVLFAGSCGGGGGSNAISSSSNTATLTWDAPGTNADGSPLTDLAGYKIYYGTTSGVYTQTINVGNVTTHKITRLPRGAAYYFVVTAYNQAGFESVPSTEGSKRIN